MRRATAIGRFALAAFGAVFCAACGGLAPTDESRPRHVILLTVDTWRADHIGRRLAGVELTPRLNELAAGAIRFTQASSVAPVTSAGVAGILTGLLPERSGVVVNDHMLPPTLPSLATLLAESGFVAGAFIANPVLKPGYGFERGFSHYQWVRRQPPYRKAKAAAVNRQALAWLDSLAAEDRVFLWVHYMEPHGPYEPPADHLALFPKEAFEAATDIPLQPAGQNGGRGGIPHYQQIGALAVSTDGREYLRRYAAEVHYLDREIGKLVDELAGRGLLDSSVLVVAADHGEALAGDHGFYFSHDHGLTEDQIGVPLLLRYPAVGAGRTVEEPVSNVDVLPTVLELVGVPMPEDFDGHSLLGPRPGHVVSQSGSQQTIREGPWKLRVIKRRQVYRLTDLSVDPGERREMSAEHGARLDELRRALARVRRLPALAESVQRQPADAEQRKRLEALGYVGQ